MVTDQALANIPLFEGLPDDALAAIAGLCHEESFAPGTAICGEGFAADRVYLLQEGTVGLFVNPTSRPGPLNISRLKSPGQAFGWSAVVGSGHYTASAKAMTDVRVIVLDGRAGGLPGTEPRGRLRGDETSGPGRELPAAHHSDAAPGDSM